MAASIAPQCWCSGIAAAIMEHPGAVLNAQMMVTLQPDGTYLQDARFYTALNTCTLETCGHHWNDVFEFERAILTANGHTVLPVATAEL